MDLHYHAVSRRTSHACAGHAVRTEFDSRKLLYAVLLL